MGKQVVIWVLFACNCFNIEVKVRVTTRMFEDNGFFVVSDSSSDQPAPSRVGLSSYTTQRLAELRARRAELESEGKVSSTASEVKPTPYSANGSSSVAASIPPASSGSSSSSSQDAFRSQRSASLASENTDSVPPAKPAVSMYRSEIRESRETNKTSEVLASNNTNNSTYSESKFKSSASSLASKEVILLEI
jgi:hypothetical protein